MLRNPLLYASEISSLLEGWGKLDAFGEPITGDRILEASGLKQVETVEGFVYVS